MKIILSIRKTPLRMFGKIKQQTYENSIEFQKDTKPHIDQSFFEELNIKKFNKKEYVRGLGDDEVPIPISPKFKPVKAYGINTYK